MSNANFDLNSIQEVLQQVISLYVRNQAVCQRPSSIVEKLFSNLSVGIYNKKIISSEEVNRIISKEMASDEEFYNQFCNWVACGKNKTAVVRYFLTSIHKYLDNSLELNLNNSEVHVEHIMPKTLNSQWETKISNEEHQEYLWKLGNLMLLSGPYNIKASNSDFETKKMIYNKSKIEPNRAVCNYDIWNKESINQRQKQLAKYALKIWHK